MLDRTLLNRMIGVPFVEQGRDLCGFDCWGVVAHGLLHGFGLTVPSYTDAYTTTEDGEAISALIGRESRGWPEIPLTEARAGDVLVLRIKGRPWHCGLVIEPPYFVHADRTLGTVRERWDALTWANRIIGLYRHPALIDACGGSGTL